jgi:hypothetical protein
MLKFLRVRKQVRTCGFKAVKMWDFGLKNLEKVRCSKSLRNFCLNLKNSEFQIKKSAEKDIVFAFNIIKIYLNLKILNPKNSKFGASKNFQKLQI